MSTHDADVVVLGGGSGGYAAALRAAELGSRVVIIEKDKVGGTCLHRGCVPTKALLRVGEVADEIRGAQRLGLDANLTAIDGARVKEFRDGIVSGKHKGLTGLLAARKITTVFGEGVLTAEGTVRVGDDEYRGENLVLAVGARTRPFPGVAVGGRILDSESALAMDEIPARVIILGGGVIGVEFASAWRSLGAEVTVIEALPRLIAAEDASASKALERAFAARGIDVRTGVSVVSASANDDSVTVTVDGGDTLTADYALVAIGRVPATDGIGLEDAHVVTDRGWIQVDEDGRTSVDGVWAVGDIVPGPQLAHRGFAQGIRVAELIGGQTPPVLDDQAIPRVTYSHPEVAAVGMTEEAARERFADNITVQEYNLAGNAKSSILGAAGFVKILRRTDGPIIGATLVGDRVGELITEVQLAIGWEAHPEDIAPFIHAHPTQSEALGEAFLALSGKPLHAL